jgi:SAM-dependent methyltransferase
MYHKSMISDASTQAISITHKHILSVLNTKLQHRSFDQPVRILDAGCGNCELTSYLQKFIPAFNDGLTVEIHGFDVSDSQVQFSDYHNSAFAMLKKRLPNIDWYSRIKIVKAKDNWPFEDAFFDIVISNHVVEHIHKPNIFFAENSRVLKKGGFSVHLFPLKNYVLEGHILLPFVHRLKNWYSIRKYIKIMSLLGFGEWKKLRRKYSLDEYSTSYSDFLYFYCHYLSMPELIRITRNAGFRTGFNFTGKFHIERLKQLLKLKHSFVYKKEHTHLLTIHLIKYISSITLLLEKKDEYINYIALPAE